MHKGRHLLIDCHNVARDICLNDGLILDAMATAARLAGATVLSQVRYHFGHNSPPGFTCAILLDESHCTAHAYADEGMIALDVFTCGDTNPHDVLREIQRRVPLGDVTYREVSRFPMKHATSAEPSVLDTTVMPLRNDGDGYVTSNVSEEDCVASLSS
ncbi:S-adenosylmethionine decarboxylase family protein [Calycomorphotria hydatis]|uniref:S-adenosylmethionine decarboxylase family protein n=1 Tax=Calycomorphotria hydatis TaxID=2528027 RepID=UPI0011A0A93C|nr:S-adenosylmethionine decarboxylase [Calycomorphotria hydatis]